MPPSHQYSELPGEEKAEGEQLQSPPKKSRWSTLSLLLILPLMFVALLALVVGIAKFISRPVPRSQIGTAEWAHEIRQTQAQYLLGVGKADITGYVQAKVEHVQKMANIPADLLSK